MKSRYLVALMLAILTLPAVAYAGVDLSEYAPKPDEPLDVWLQRVLITSAVASVLYAWTWIRGKKAAQKVTKHIDEHKLVQMIATQAVDYAEELGHRARKAGETLASEIKENKGIERGIELLEKYGFDTKKARKDAEDELRKVIRARLGAGRGGKA